MNRKGSNQFRTKYKYPLGLSEGAVHFILLVIIGALLGIIFSLKVQPKIISPLPDDFSFNGTVLAYNGNPTPTPKPDIDEWVDKMSKKYGRGRYEQNRIKVVLHFLLLKEQNYGGSNACGDGGAACGPLQFHEPTYQGYRKQMIKEGNVTYVGSRLDIYDAVETAAWAISTGREKAWGPMLRGEIKV